MILRFLINKRGLDFDQEKCWLDFFLIGGSGVGFIDFNQDKGVEVFRKVVVDLEKNANLDLEKLLPK